MGWVSFMPKVSIVMTAYRRPDLLKNTLDSIFSQHYEDKEVIVVEDGHDGETEPLCQQYPVKYLCRRHRPLLPFSNPAIPCNMGIKAATGEILLLQNAECQHVTPDLIQKLTDRVTADTAQFPRVESLDAEGKHERWFTHENPGLAQRRFFFCGAILRETIISIGGYDEDYLTAAFDDNDLSDRLQAMGIEEVVNPDLLVYHQWHERPGWSAAENGRVFESKQGANFTIIRNQGREWGIDR